MNQPRDKSGRFLTTGSSKRNNKKSSKSPKTASTKAVPLTKVIASQIDPSQLTSHFIILADVSGSMANMMDNLNIALREQFRSIVQGAADHKQNATITLYSFSSTSRCELRGVPATHIPSTNIVCAHGQTALISATVEAINDALRIPNYSDPNTSFLVFIITDGEENSSSAYSKNEFNGLMKVLKNDPRWSFAGIGPKTCIQHLVNIGFPAGNVRAWDGSVQELTQNIRVADIGTQSYYSMKARGCNSTQSFMADLDGVTLKDLKALDDESNNFRTLHVTKEDDISNFITNNVGSFTLGKAFYELTKPERVQNGKDIAIVHGASGRIFTGKKARDLLGVPNDCDIRLRPGNQHGHKVFVQSTSSNRKLLPNTIVLYRNT